MATQENLYYSISEVSELTEVEAYTLRYWEKEFPKLRPKKSKKGQRTYTKKDIDVIQSIKELLYQRKYTIKGAREKLKKSTAEKPAAKPVAKAASTSSASQDSRVKPEILKELKGEVTLLKKRLTTLLKVE